MEQWIRRNPFVLPITLISLEIGLFIGSKLYKVKTGRPLDDQIVLSPVKSLLPKLSPEETASLPYPPDAYPGIRDVASPYGSLRVYEWGPEEGRKVLLVHGISNPCIALGAIAHGLADKGCRVMIFDLPGRGYSDTPVPTPHSSRLYTTTILLALASSPLSWTGNRETFSLIGYSLGGGIVANFTSYFPTLVSSLVLLAPAGLVRESRITLMNKILYNTGLINEQTLERLVMGRMRREAPLLEPTRKENPSIETAIEGEMPKAREKDSPSPPALSRIRPETKILGVIPWQLDNHAGYVKSFVSSIRYGPITGQHADWQRIAKRLSAQNASSEERYEKDGLQNGKVLIIAGHKDVLIAEDELVEDATEILGENNVRFEFVDAGHELPVSRSKDVLEIISAFWEKGLSMPRS